MAFEKADIPSIYMPLLYQCWRDFLQVIRSPFPFFRKKPCEISCWLKRGVPEWENQGKINECLQQKCLKNVLLQ